MLRLDYNYCIFIFDKFGVCRIFREKFPSCARTSGNCIGPFTSHTLATHVPVQTVLISKGCVTQYRTLLHYVSNLFSPFPLQALPSACYLPKDCVMNVHRIEIFRNSYHSAASEGISTYIKVTTKNGRNINFLSRKRREW